MTLSGGQIITDFLQMTKLVSCVTLSYTRISGGTNNLAYSRENCISYIRRLRYSPSLDHLGQCLSHVLKGFLLCQSHFFPQLSIKRKNTAYQNCQIVCVFFSSEWQVTLSDRAPDTKHFATCQEVTTVLCAMLCWTVLECSSKKS